MSVDGSSASAAGRRRRAMSGDVVTLRSVLLEPEDGFVPEPLFDTKGRISFVLDGGNYLPGLHELVRNCQVGDRIDNVSIDAGWGARRYDMIFSITQDKLNKVVAAATTTTTGSRPVGTYKVGDTLKLEKDIEVIIQSIATTNHNNNDDNNNTTTIIQLDANPPLAGSSYACSFTVEAVESIKDNNNNNRYQTATFALECFWGAELLMMRIPGVVGTEVGYSQGTTCHPTYEQVKTGQTQHREAVQVTFDSTVVSYRDLVEIALQRLHDTQSPLELHRLFEQDDYGDDGHDLQYKHGIYYHCNKQREIAHELLQLDGNAYLGVELLEATTFWKAEDWHQQYLYKGGQSARKGAKQPIRCFG